MSPLFSSISLFSWPLQGWLSYLPEWSLSSRLLSSWAPCYTVCPFLSLYSRLCSCTPLLPFLRNLPASLPHLGPTFSSMHSPVKCRDLNLNLSKSRTIFHSPPDQLLCGPFALCFLLGTLCDPLVSSILSSKILLLPGLLLLFPAFHFWVQSSHFCSCNVETDFWTVLSFLTSSLTHPAQCQCKKHPNLQRIFMNLFEQNWQLPESNISMGWENAL